MLDRARERFRSRAARRVPRGRPGALPNLIVIGGLKCGTTSLHHYLNLHPEIGMSRPKELNFFVEELNWPLGEAWYASHFPADAPVRGESSPHYTNLPRFPGVAERMRATIPEARMIYMVRDPIDRALSHFLHNVAGGYETRSMEDAVADPANAYVHRGMYAMQVEPYLKAFGERRIELVSQEELKLDRDRTVRRVFEFAGVDPGFTSPQFDREWETGTGKRTGRFTAMDRAVRLPGLRALDRNFDRMPEPVRWVIEKVVHDPGGAPARPELPANLRARLAERFAPDTERLRELTGRRFEWDASRVSESVDLVKRGIEAINTEGWEALVPLIDADFELVTNSAVALEPDTYRGEAGLRRYFESFEDAMEEIRILPDSDPVGAGDRVVVSFRLSARGKETGIVAEQAAHMLWTIRDGRALRVEFFTERGAALEAAGLDPGA